MYFALGLVRFIALYSVLEVGTLQEQLAYHCSWVQVSFDNGAVLVHIVLEIYTDACHCQNVYKWRQVPGVYSFIIDINCLWLRVLKYHMLSTETSLGSNR